MSLLRFATGNAAAIAAANQTATEKSSVSHEIEIPFYIISASLSGAIDTLPSSTLASEILLRIERLQRCANPYGVPNKTSRDKFIPNATIATKFDGSFKLTARHIEHTLAISDEFGLDEVEAYVLYRSLLFNRSASRRSHQVKPEGKPEVEAEEVEQLDITELIDAFAESYFEERLAILSTFQQLLQAYRVPDHQNYTLAHTHVPKITGAKPAGFLEYLLAQYKLRSTSDNATPPSYFKSTSRLAQRYGQQLLVEQSAILEILIWLSWTGLVMPGVGAIPVVQTAYATDLGRVQELASSVYIEDERQTERLSSLWCLLCISIFDLTSLLYADPMELTASSERVAKIHEPSVLEGVHKTLSGTPQDSRYGPILLAWAYVLFKLGEAVARAEPLPPSEYIPFLEKIIPGYTPEAYEGERNPDHLSSQLTEFSITKLHVLEYLRAIVDQSSIFIGTRHGNAPVIYRGLVKGLLMALTELIRVEYLPSFESISSLWYSLFDSTPQLSVDYWTTDAPHPARIAVLEKTAASFPLQTSPLVKLVRSMTGFSLSLNPKIPNSDISLTATAYALRYFASLDSYIQVLQQSGPMGFRSIWETETDNNMSMISTASGSGIFKPGEVFYVNTKPFKLPGGSILPPRSRGKLVSGGSGKPLVVRWLHKHSGWSLLVDLLITLWGSNNRGTFVKPSEQHKRSKGAMIKKNAYTTKPVLFNLESIGMQIGGGDNDSHYEPEDRICLTIEIMELFRAVLEHPDPTLHEELFDSIDSYTTNEEGQPDISQRIDLVQITIAILEETLSSAVQTQTKKSAGAIAQYIRLISSTIFLLSSLTHVRSAWVWPLMRSTNFLGFTTTNSNTSTSNVIQILTAERSTGSYTITLAILDLLRSLFNDAVLGDFTTSPSHDLKGEVLLGAIKTIHFSVWSEHIGWKYAVLGDRFEIGRRITQLYKDILRNWNLRSQAPGTPESPVFKPLAEFLVDSFLYRASSTALTPLIHPITIGHEVLKSLKQARRENEEDLLILLMQSHLEFLAQLLVIKRSSIIASRQCLLEQSLCNGASSNTSSSLSLSRISRQATKHAPIDVIASYINSGEIGPVSPVLATRVISSLCLSFSEIQPSPPSLTLLGVEDIATDFVQIIQGASQDFILRNTLWELMATSIACQSTLSSSFVTGSVDMRAGLRLAGESKGEESEDRKGKGKATDVPKSGTSTLSLGKTTTSGDPTVPSTPSTVLQAAIRTASNWESLWKENPILLCSILRFISVVWQHAVEYPFALEGARSDSQFWKGLVFILRQTISSVPIRNEGVLVPVVQDGMEVDEVVLVDESEYFAKVETFAYQTMAQSYTVEIFAIETSLQKPTGAGMMALKNFVQVGDSFVSHLFDATVSSLDLTLHERVMVAFANWFPQFNLESLRSPLPAPQRPFGPAYFYEVELIEPRLENIIPGSESPTELIRLMNDTRAVNCNWSIVDAQISLTTAWKRFLQAGGARKNVGDDGKKALFKLCIDVSATIAKEERGGSIMVAVHAERLGVLLALLESIWSLDFVKDKDVAKQFMDLLKNLQAILKSETFPPMESIRLHFIGNTSTPSFHRIVLQIAYFCSVKAKTLTKEARHVTAEQRSVIAVSMLSVAGFVATALKELFEAAKVTQDWELDKDIELLVAVFEQCTRPELHTSPRVWLEGCNELDLFRSSLELLMKTDIGAEKLSGDLLRTVRNPLYVRHLLNFYLCLSTRESAAESLAAYGAMFAFCKLSISNELSAGDINVLHPELPGERSPGHQAWCSLLSIVTGLIGSVGGSSSNFIETEVTSFVQLYGAQLSRTLEWNVGQSLNSAILEELEATVGLFYAMALRVNPRSAADVQASLLLSTFSEKSLILLQHLNYVLSHPNHLASLFEVVTSEERRQLEKEISQTEEMSSSLEMVDCEKRPFMASLTQRIHSIVRDITTALVIINCGDEILVGDPDDWPSVPKVAPTTKVTLGEIATIGTLIELGNGAVEIMQHLNGPAGSKTPSNVSMPHSSTPIFDTKVDLRILGQSLESIAMLSVTQLAVWHHQITTAAAEPTMEEDLNYDWDGKESTLILGGAKKMAMLVSLGGDVLNDLVGMLGKMKTVVKKTGSEETKQKDIISMLEGFLESKVLR